MKSLYKSSLVSSVLVLASSGSAGALAESDAASVFATMPIRAAAAPPQSGWAQLQFVDMETFPWDEQPRYHSRSKTIFNGPKGDEGLLVWCIFNPSWTTEMPKGGGLGPHYHPYWEWGFTLKGDSALTEPVSPDQKNGMFYRKSEGGWLTRPPNGLHGGGWATGGKRAQNPYHLLIFEEGDGSVITVGANSDHFFPDWPDRKPDPYMPDNWKSVKRWERPWLVDTVRDLEWEDDPKVAGRMIKWLDDDMEYGFRSQLVKVPPGWRPPDGMRGSYYETANVMRYLIYGDLNVWTFDSPDDDSPGVVKLKQDSFIYQPARSIWGYGEGPVTELGAVWLEVTYSHGVSHSEGSGPVPDPIVFD